MTLQRKPVTGQALKLRSLDWHALIDAGLAQRAGPHAPADEVLKDRPTDLAKVRNDDASTWPRFAAVALYDALILPADNLPEFQQFPGLLGRVPTAGDVAESPQRVGISLTGQPADTIGDVQVSGVVPCQVNLLDEAHRFAGLTDGQTYLTSGTTGPIEILWIEDAAPGYYGAARWALVRWFGGGGGSTPGAEDCGGADKNWFRHCGGPRPVWAWYTDMDYTPADTGAAFRAKNLYLHPFLAPAGGDLDYIRLINRSSPVDCFTVEVHVGIYTRKGAGGDGVGDQTPGDLLWSATKTFCCTDTQFVFPIADFAAGYGPGYGPAEQLTLEPCELYWLATSLGGRVKLEGGLKGSFMPVLGTDTPTGLEYVQSTAGIPGTVPETNCAQGLQTKVPVVFVHYNCPHENQRVKLCLHNVTGECADLELPEFIYLDYWYTGDGPIGTCQYDIYHTGCIDLGGVHWTDIIYSRPLDYKITETTDSDDGEINRQCEDCSQNTCAFHHLEFKSDETPNPIYPYLALTCEDGTLCGGSSGPVSIFFGDLEPDDGLPPFSCDGAILGTILMPVASESASGDCVLPDCPDVCYVVEPGCCEDTQPIPCLLKATFMSDEAGFACTCMNNGTLTVDLVYNGATEKWEGSGSIPDDCPGAPGTFTLSFYCDSAGDDHNPLNWRMDIAGTGCVQSITGLVVGVADCEPLAVTFSPTESTFDFCCGVAGNDLFIVVTEP